MLRRLLFLLGTGAAVALHAQGFPMDTVPLDDLSFWQSPTENWRLAGTVRADLAEEKRLTTKRGRGVLVNLPIERAQRDLFSKMKHGDLDLEMDVLLATNSNSGIYLQGRYEIQLFDSWGKPHVGFADMGGVYERWDDARGSGNEGYDGTAPRANAARAPGLWQTLKIRFEAPRFDSYGRKTRNARLLEVQLNGVTIHENLELTGPTRGAMGNDEVKTGPLRIQGDHGPVAFRRLRYRNYTGKPIEVDDLTYKVTRSNWYPRVPDNLNELKVDDRGETRLITWEVARSKNDFVTQIEGYLKVPREGRHQFWLESRGASSVWIDGKKIFDQNFGRNTASVELRHGRTPIRVVYAKNEGWRPAQLGLFVEGQHFRRVPLHYASSYALTEPVPKITTNPRGEVRLLRSFVDFTEPGETLTYRLPYAINVGHPARIHYTYNLANGALVRVWRGDFLDNTPMWHNRGDGSARPQGAIVDLSDEPPLAVLTDQKAAWPDTLVHETTDFKYLGYDLDAAGLPTFRYRMHGVTVLDKIAPLDGGRGFARTINIEGKAPNRLTFRLGKGHRVDRLNEYILVDDQRYYLNMGDVKANIRNTTHGQEVLLPVGVEEIYYELLF